MMSETASYPQIRYLPEDGVLEVESRDFSAADQAGANADETSRLASRWAYVEALAGMPGVHADSGETRTVIWAEPEKLFASSTPIETLSRFLAYLNHFLPAYPENGVDYTIGLEAATGEGADGLVLSAYDRYQVWLEHGLVGDEVLRRTLAAAVLPLRPGLEPIRLDRTFQYKRHGDTEHASVGDGSMVTSIGIVRDEFTDVGRSIGDSDVPEGRERVDLYLLRHVGIERATGDEFGVRDSERQHFMPDHPRLYEMQPAPGATSHPRELAICLPWEFWPMKPQASRVAGR